jgi:hypothetical protein
MEYLDFEVSIDEDGAGHYRVVVIESPAGEDRHTLAPPFTRDQLRVWLQSLHAARVIARGDRDVVITEPPADGTGHRSAKELGRALFGLVFGGPIIQLYRESVQEARKVPDRGLRIKLRTPVASLAALPWELLHDPRTDDFVCLSNSTPLVRYVEAPQPPRPLTVTQPLRILGMVACPKGLPQLDVAKEKARIEQAVSAPDLKGAVTITWVDGETPAALSRAMGHGNGPWHVFHFIGHGGYDSRTGEGHIALSSEDGARYDLSALGLSRVLGDHRTLRLTVLNACKGASGGETDLFSSTAAILVRQGLPAVIAMQDEVSDAAAIEFSTVFYRTLLRELPVDLAVAEARKAISLDGTRTVEWATPVLHMRAPNGRLFELAGKAPSKPPVPGPVRPGLLSLAAALCPPALAALLAFLPVRDAALNLEADVTGVGVTLPTRRILADPLDLTTIDVSGVAAIDVPPPFGEGAIPAENLMLAAVGESGRLTVSLDRDFPHGTYLRLTTTVEPGTYELILGDSIPDLAVTALGPVLLDLDDQSRQLEFPAPTPLRLQADGELGFEFTPRAGFRPDFTERLPILGLDLTRVHQVVSDGAPDFEESSTILGGTYTLEGVGRRPLEAKDALRAEGIQGEISRLELAGDRLKLALSGRVSALSTGSGEAQRSLMPTVLAWSVREHWVWVLVLTAGYLIAMTFLVRRWRRRPS